MVASRKHFGGGGVQLLAVLLIWASAAAGQSPSDFYTPVCPITATPKLGWHQWSNPATWPYGIVPGSASARGVDVKIPCNKGIILDVPVLDIGTLVVNGWLKVTAQGPFQVNANFVIVQGKLSIGTETQPYTGKITFNLTNGDGSTYNINRPPGGNVYSTVGTKAFAVVGGQVILNGMYDNGPTWSKLSATAPAGATSITLRQNIGSWPIGGEIAISSTDFDRHQKERLFITGKSGNTLHLSAPLQYMHWGELDCTNKILGVAMDESAEVALLTRSIVIQGDPNPAGQPFLGGHFIVFQTHTPQHIIGVELVNMGQQGLLGRYPMHFHLCQDVTGSYIKKCSVHDSNQRCFVVHGTWNHLVQDNVGVDTLGHCFMVEDGIEHGNMFQGNLAFGQEPVTTLIPSGANGATESDDTPSSFWISNPNNSFVGNVAGGAFDSGFWFQLLESVAGPSAGFPSAATVQPKFIAVAEFSNNVAHSNGRAGLRTYPSGYRPRLNGGVSSQQSTQGINAPAQVIYFEHTKLYKNEFDGAFVHETDSLHWQGAMVADNAVVGIEFDRDEACWVSNSYFFGETDNIGNPSQCDQQGNNYANCKAITGCAYPPSPSNARSNGITSRYSPQFGILIDQDEYPSHGLTSLGNSNGPPIPHQIRNSQFALFNSECRIAAGITANGKEQNVWPASHRSQGLKFAAGTDKFYFAPESRGMLGFESYADAGPEAQMYVWRDLDGTLVGGKGGYAVANNTAILPAKAGACTKTPAWNGYACPGVCYRTIGVTVSGSDSVGFTVTRVADGSLFTVSGNSYGSTTFLNLLAGGSYEISISGSPSQVSVQFGDAMGCNGGVTLQFPPPASGQQWSMVAGPGAFFQACAGTALRSKHIIQAASICSGGTPVMEVNMGSYATQALTLSAVSGSASCSTLQCGLIISGSVWSYDDNGQNLNQAYAAPSYSVASWKKAPAMFGYGGVQGIVTNVESGSQMNGLTWYFRTSFTLSKASCIQTLTFGTIVNDGVLVSLNGQEVFRNNMPSGPVTASTPALSGLGNSNGFTVNTFSASSLNLVDGVNTLAVEVHTYATWAWEIRFDMWIAATGTSCAASSFFNKGALTRVAVMPRKKTAKPAHPSSKRHQKIKRIPGHHVGHTPQPGGHHSWKVYWRTHKKGHKFHG